MADLNSATGSSPSKVYSLVKNVLKPSTVYQFARSTTSSNAPVTSTAFELDLPRLTTAFWSLSTLEPNSGRLPSNIESVHIQALATNVLPGIQINNAGLDRPYSLQRMSGSFSHNREVAPDSESAEDADTPVLCCTAVLDVTPFSKLFQDPSRGVYKAVMNSFMEFNHRHRNSRELARIENGLPVLSLYPVPITTATSEDPSNPANYLNNPLDARPAFVIHIYARFDYGLVFSHRYFACPNHLGQDWIEISKLHFWAKGSNYKAIAKNTDFKCSTHNRFFRMELRGNLRARGPEYSEISGTGKEVEEEYY